MTTPGSSGRSSDRVEHVGSKRPGHRAGGEDFASGTVASAGRRLPTTYLTSARLRSLSASLSESDWNLLETIRRFRLATGDQLRRLRFGADEAGARAARRALQRLTRQQVLGRLDRRIGGVRAGSSGYVYRVGPSGHRLLGERRRVLDEVGLFHLQHTLAITEWYVRLASPERPGAATLYAFDPEPDSWRSYLGRHGEPQILKPDAFCDVRLDGRRRLWFLEVDRGTVSTTTLRQKLARYGEYYDTGTEQARRRGVFPRVVWATPEGPRSEHLAALLATENERVGAELHRLMSDEWPPP